MSTIVTTLGDILKYEQPTKYIVSTKNYNEKYETPVLTAGKTFILGNTNEKDNIFPVSKLPVIIFDDFTTAIQFVNFSFKVKSSAMKILHAKKGVVDAKYAFYLMQTLKFDHTSHKRYWISQYSNIEIFLPPIEEQKKIVGRLELLLGKIKEAKKLNEEAQKAADSLLSAELHKIFEEGKKKGWIKMRLGSVVKKTEIVNPKKTFKKEFPYIDISSVSSRVSERISPKLIFVESAPSRAKKLVKSEDIIFATTRPYLRNIAYISNTLDNAIASTGFCVIRANKETIDPKFLYQIVNSKSFIDEVVSFQKGATYPSVSDSVIFDREILVPTLPEQKKIVERLDGLSEKINKLKEFQKQTALDLDALEKSILHQAFHQN